MERGYYRALFPLRYSQAGHETEAGCVTMELPDWDAVYAQRGMALWETGWPQPAFQWLSGDGLLAGRVLEHEPGGEPPPGQPGRAAPRLRRRLDGHRHRA